MKIGGEEAEGSGYSNERDIATSMGGLMCGHCFQKVTRLKWNAADNG